MVEILVKFIDIITLVLITRETLAGSFHEKGVQIVIIPDAVRKYLLYSR